MQEFLNAISPIRVSWSPKLVGQNQNLSLKWNGTIKASRKDMRVLSHARHGTFICRAMAKVLFESCWRAYWHSGYGLSLVLKCVLSMLQRFCRCCITLADSSLNYLPDSLAIFLRVSPFLPFRPRDDGRISLLNQTSELSQFLQNGMIAWYTPRFFHRTWRFIWFPR